MNLRLKVEIFRQAANDTGLRVSVTSTERPYIVSENQEVPAVKLTSEERDLEPFWKRVAELEADATQKAG